MPYTNNPTSTNTDGVRVLVGDISTSTSHQYLADTAYAYFRKQTSNQFAAASLAANSLAAFFMTDGSQKHVGDLSLKRDLANTFKALSVEFKIMSAKQIAPYAGGISQSDRKIDDQNQDRVKPMFLRGQFDNRYAMDPQRTTST